MGVSLSLSFCLTAKTHAEIFGNAAGLGSQPLHWRRSITQTDREVTIGLRRWWSRSLSPSIVKVRVVGWWSLSLCLLLSLR